jgi:ABC-type dipeptide/oligopeptide/nickel transport system permease subunit
VIEEKASDYHTAAVSAGLRRPVIVARELAPNLFPALLVQFSLIVGYGILTEAALSFLGLGVQPPTASWGSLLHDGYTYVYNSPTYAVFPGIAVFATVWSLNVIGDSVRDFLDPRNLG